MGVGGRLAGMGSGVAGGGLTAGIFDIRCQQATPRRPLLPIQLTVTDGTWFMGCELPDAADVGNDAVQERLGEFCLAVMERHGVDVLGLGFCTEVLN